MSHGTSQTGETQTTQTARAGSLNELSLDPNPTTDTSRPEHFLQEPVVDGQSMEQVQQIRRLQDAFPNVGYSPQNLLNVLLARIIDALNLFQRFENTRSEPCSTS